MTLGSRVPATVLLVDDDLEYLELRAQFMKAFGFSVVTAPGPIEGHIHRRESDRPDQSGRCRLSNAGHERVFARRPSEVDASRTEDHSSLWPPVTIPENQMTNIDVFISKSDELARLITSVSEHATRIGQQSAFPARRGTESRTD